MKKIQGYGGRYYSGNTVMKFIERMGLNFARGNVIKYVSRAGEKDPRTEVEDLNKAMYYLQREINQAAKRIACMKEGEKNGN